jgi:Spy/CpxP family protein refolding chaperone
MEKIAKNLGITREQQDQIAAIRLKALKIIIPLRAEAKVKELELKSAIAPREPDSSQVFKLADEIGAIRIKIAREWLAGVIDMKKILTEDQMNKLLQVMENFRMMRKDKATERRTPMNPEAKDNKTE